MRSWLDLLKFKRSQNFVRNGAQRKIWSYMVTLGLSIRQFDVPRLEQHVGDLAQQMRDDVQPATLLVVRVCDKPRRPRRVGGSEYLVTGPRIFEPSAIGQQVQVRQL